MNQIFLLTFIFFSLQIFHLAANQEPIDAVIPAIVKDEMTIQHCIEGIRKNCKGIRRIIVVSPQKITEEAEWFDESQYPFSQADVSLYLNGMDKDRASSYLNEPLNRVGWYYQQLLKLYAPSTIPGISSNVLIVDADTVFLRPVEFVNHEGKGKFATGSEYHYPYFEHAHRLLPGLKREHPSLSGITHHMMFQKPILDDLFIQVESLHQKEFWKAFCLCVDRSQIFASASEYEIYFNFTLAQKEKGEIRDLSWINSREIHQLAEHREKGYDYVTYHAWMRN